MFAYFDCYFEKTIKRNVTITRKYLEECQDMEVSENDHYMDALKTFRTAMINIIGKPLGPEIFKHESNIYLDVQSEIKEIHHKECWRIYDAFYYNYPGFDVASLIKNKAYDYLREINHYKNYGTLIKTAVSFDDLAEGNFKPRKIHNNYIESLVLLALADIDDNKDYYKYSTEKNKIIDISLVKEHRDNFTPGICSG